VIPVGNSSLVGPPRVRSGITALYRGIKAYFEQNGIEAPVFLGLKARDNWDTSRVILIDGTFDGTSPTKPLKAGTFGAPWQKQSSNPRELASWPRPFTLSIRGVDRSRTQDEGAQLEAMDQLIEATFQAVWNATDGAGRNVGQANIEWGEGLWVLPPVQQSFGRELLVAGIHKEVLFDRGWPIAFPSVGTLTKVIRSPNPCAGSAASMVSAAGGTALVGGLTNTTATMVGQHLVLSGFATPGNNGTFPIAFWPGDSALVIQNASAGAPDQHNGAGTWSIQP
jgi:hypothetical protein